MSAMFKFFAGKLILFLIMAVVFAGVAAAQVASGLQSWPPDWLNPTAWTKPQHLGLLVTSLFAGVSAVGTVMAWLSPAFSAKDGKKLAAKLEDVHEAVNDQGAATRSAVRQGETAIRGDIGEVKSKLDALIAQLSEQRAADLAAQGRTATADEQADFEAQVRALLASKDTRKAPAQEALVAGNTTLAADRLMIVARQEAAAVDDIGRSAAETAREAGALYRATAPAKALEAYRLATRLDGTDFWAWIFLARLEQSHAGNLPAARTAAEAALRVAGTEHDRAISAETLGDIAVAAGNLSAAKQQYESRLDIAERLATADPTSADKQRDLSVSLIKLGDVAVKAGDLATARAQFQRSLDIRERLAAADPTSADKQRDLSVSLIKLGDVAVTAGDLANAIAHYERSLPIARALAEANPSHPGLQNDYAITKRVLARLKG